MESAEPRTPRAGEAEVAVDEDPVEGEVDEVGGDEGEGDGADLAYSLKIAAESAIDQQGEGAPVEDADIGAGEGGDGGVDAAAGEDQLRGEHGEHQQRREGERDVDGLGEGAVAVVEAASAPGLRDEGVETEEQADAEEGRRVVDGVAEADGADGVRARRPTIMRSTMVMVIQPSSERTTGMARVRRARSSSPMRVGCWCCSKISTAGS